MNFEIERFHHSNACCFMHAIKLTMQGEEIEEIISEYNHHTSSLCYYCTLKSLDEVCKEREGKCEHCPRSNSNGICMYKKEIKDIERIKSVFEGIL